MVPYVLRAPQQRIITDELFDSTLQKATTMSKIRNPLVVHLAGGTLHFEHLERLTMHFERTQTRVFALDMSMNRIQTDWASLNEIVNRLLVSSLVWYLDLGMNYLPAISSLDESLAVTKLCKAGTETKLEFGL